MADQEFKQVYRETQMKVTFRRIKSFTSGLPVFSVDVNASNEAEAERLAWQRLSEKYPAGKAQRIFRLVRKENNALATSGNLRASSR